MERRATTIDGVPASGGQAGLIPAQSAFARICSRIGVVSFDRSSLACIELGESI